MKCRAGRLGEVAGRSGRLVVLPVPYGMVTVS